MPNVDEFESLFRSAAKKTFTLKLPAVNRVLVLSDLEPGAHDRYVAALRELLYPLGDGLEWISHAGTERRTVENVLKLVLDEKPDLICTYRNLYSNAWQWNYSLGVHLNVLSRGTTLPVLVTPSPHGDPENAWKRRRADSIMVATDHLTGDDALVNWGLKLTRSTGTLHLLHVEPDEIFARYIDAISKIPDLDTDVARETIQTQLLAEPSDYIESCKQVLADSGSDIQVDGLVVTGHRVSEYRVLLSSHAVDILVFPTLEEDRIALHGVAYSLAVELVKIPVLMV